MKKAFSLYLILFVFLIFSVPQSRAAFGQNPVKEALQPYVDQQTMGGFVSILAAPDGTLQIDCVGYADVENRIPMRPDTMFALFSCSKSVCGTALMILIDQGKISLDDPVEKYLPEFADMKIKIQNPDGSETLAVPKRKVTIRDCMSHVTGSRTDGFNRSGSVRDSARALAAAPLQFQPGETFRYGNSWIDTGAAILEVVTGMKYEEFLQKNIFAPLGMKDTTFWPNEEQQKRLAKCYPGNGTPAVKGLDGWFSMYLRTPLELEKLTAHGASGLYSTPQDFIRFSQMLAHRGEFEGKRIVSEKTFLEILAVKQTPEEVSQPYTVGNWIYGDWLGHEGALRTDARANIRTGHARLYFVQTTAGKAFAQSKLDWHKAADEVQGTEPPFSGGN